MRNADGSGNRTGHFDVFSGTAQTGTVLAGVKMHGDAGDFVSLLAQEECRAGAVYAAAHGNAYMFGHKIPLSSGLLYPRGRKKKTTF
jgi:hypothetical protein